METDKGEDVYVMNGIRSTGRLSGCSGGRDCKAASRTLDWIKDHLPIGQRLRAWRSSRMQDGCARCARVVSKRQALARRPQSI